jgi:hypothetical protein
MSHLKWVTLRKRSSVCSTMFNELSDMAVLFHLLCWNGIYSWHNLLYYLKMSCPHIWSRNTSPNVCELLWTRWWTFGVRHQGSTLWISERPLAKHFYFVYVIWICDATCSLLCYAAIKAFFRHSQHHYFGPYNGHKGSINTGLDAYAFILECSILRP